MQLQELQIKIKSAFSELEFNEKNHTYKYRGLKLPSVSSKVESHAPEFDEEYWLPICARKEQLTEHELKHKWQTINQTACDLGHETHDFLERYNGLTTPTTPQQKAGIKFFVDILQDYTIVARELRMFSWVYKYAGTTDLLLMHKTTGELVIADYKTNADLFKTFGLLLPPFAYLENHPFSKYQLQLSYYDIMLEEIGLHIPRRILVYLMADETYKIYDCFDFKPQLKEHMQNQKKIINEAW